MMSAAWRVLAAHPGALVGAPLLVSLVYTVVALAGFLAIAQSGALPRLDALAQLPPELWAPEMMRVMNSPAIWATLLAWTVGVTVVDSFFRGGLVRLRLAAVRGEPVRFGELFSGGSCFGRMLGLRLLIGAPSLVSSSLRLLAAVTDSAALRSIGEILGNVAGLGLLALLPFGLVLAESFVVDSRRGPVEALRAAFAAPAPDRGGVFGFLILAGLVAFAGLCCCGVGGLVTVPYASACVGVLYVRLVGPRA
jgi:hypothetical protein